MPAMFRIVTDLKACGGMWSMKAFAPNYLLVLMSVRNKVYWILNWTLTWYHPDGPLSVEKIADHYTDLFFNGLLKKQKE